MSTSQADGVAQREAVGKAAREHTPRSCHGEWKAAKDRDDPIAILEAQGTSRVQELLPIRYGRMARSAAITAAAPRKKAKADVAIRP